MKTLTAIFSIFLIMSFIGCQESLVNQPDIPINSELNKTAQADNHNTFSPVHTTNGEISVLYKMYDPLTGDCKVTGKVDYTHSMYGFSPGDQNLAKIEVKLEMNSELITRLMSPVKYEIHGKSVDIVYVQGKGTLILEKNYEISNRPDLRLGVQYSVTAEGVTIAKMVLHQIDY